VPPIYVDGYEYCEDDVWDLDFEAGYDDGEEAWCDDETDDGSYDDDDEELSY
jgi:hypothetical protein